MTCPLQIVPMISERFSPQINFASYRNTFIAKPIFSPENYKDPSLKHAHVMTQSNLANKTDKPYWKRALQGNKKLALTSVGAALSRGETGVSIGAKKIFLTLPSSF